MSFFGKSKQLEERIAQLEQELTDARTSAEQELQAERSSRGELEEAGAKLLFETPQELEMFILEK